MLGGTSISVKFRTRNTAREENMRKRYKTAVDGVFAVLFFEAAICELTIVHNGPVLFSGIRCCLSWMSTQGFGQRSIWLMFGQRKQPASDSNWPKKGQIHSSFFFK